MSNNDIKGLLVVYLMMFLVLMIILSGKFLEGCFRAFVWSEREVYDPTCVDMTIWLSVFIGSIALICFTYQLII